MARRQPPALERRAVPDDRGGRFASPGVEEVEGILAATEGGVMATFRFHLIGSAQPIELEVSAATASDLNAMLSCQRFVEGRMTQPDGDGVLLGMLIATSRIQCVVES